LHLLRTGGNKISVLSFFLEDIHPYDAGMIIDKYGIAVRTGNHCAQPVMQRFGIRGPIRASLVFYNTMEEIDRLCEAIEKVKQMFRIKSMSEMTMNEIQEEIVEEFEIFDDWLDKYNYLIELSKSLPCY
jgi:hypothetical protein